MKEPIFGGITEGTTMSDVAKREVLKRIAKNRPPFPSGRALWQIGGLMVHVRFCSPDKSGASRFKFNINPTTLSADYELWICGDENTFYLVPHSTIKEMYEDPHAYVDRHHKQLTVVTVESSLHSATYAKGGKSIDIEEFYQQEMPE
jgi:hypothetical protein